MQPLVNVDQHSIAQTFVNYLKRLDIDADIQQHQGSYVIFCRQEHIEQARALFVEYARSPYHPKYQQDNLASNEQHDALQGNHNSSGLLNRFINHGGMVTLTVFALCWVSFLASLLGWQYSIFNTLQFYPSLSIEQLLSAPQRLLGPAFLHFSWLHIVFNTMWWWQLGGEIEQRLGKGVLLQLFIVSALLSNVGQFLVSGPNFGGLSGVVYAVLGFVWWMSWLKPEKGFYISNSLIGFMLVWLMLGFVDLLPVNVANTAHLAGLVSGCLFALWQAKRKSSSE